MKNCVTVEQAIHQQFRSAHKSIVLALMVPMLLVIACNVFSKLTLIFISLEL